MVHGLLRVLKFSILQIIFAFAAGRASIYQLDSHIIGCCIDPTGNEFPDLWNWGVSYFHLNWLATGFSGILLQSKVCNDSVQRISDNSVDFFAYNYRDDSSVKRQLRPRIADVRSYILTAPSANKPPPAEIGKQGTQLLGQIFDLCCWIQWSPFWFLFLFAIWFEADSKEVVFPVTWCQKVSQNVSIIKSLLFFQSV